MTTLEEAIKQVPQGYRWLIRSDEARGYFANLVRKEYIQVISNGVDNLRPGDNFPTYWDDPAQALMMSIEVCNRYLKEQAKRGKAS